MAITQTALTADLSATGLTMTVSSGTGFPAVAAGPSQNYLVRIDKEYMLAISQPSAGVIKLAQRGYHGTAAVAHDTGAKVSVSAAPSDFAGPSAGNSVDLPPYLPSQHTIGEDVTFTAAQIAAWGNQPQTFAITKAGVAAVVLAAPSKAQDGLNLRFTSLTANAHTITATGLVGDGASGSPEDLITFDAFIGATITLEAQNGIYNVVSNVATVVS